MLPVHLHADDKTAAEKYGDPNGKSEAWHILWAAPGATILAGLKDGLSREDLFAAFKAQDYDRVMPRYRISAGDTVYVPGGIIHAFGPDTLIFEVQQTSDLAQSVMPGDLFGNTYPEQEWDRRINETLDELRDYYKPRPNPGLELRVGENLRSFGCAGPHFALERWTLREGQVLPANPRRCTTISCVGESVSLRYAGGSEVLAKGESCVLPAAIGEVRVIPDNEASLIVCYVPDLQRDVIEPLRAAGHSLEAIRSLGEVGV
jgi:mannose-6-phosphate isomerase